MHIGMHNEMNKMVSKLHNHKHNIYICTSNQAGHNSLAINKKRAYTLNTQCTYPIICSG